MNFNLASTNRPWPRLFISSRISFWIVYYYYGNNNYKIGTFKDHLGIVKCHRRIVAKINENKTFLRMVYKTLWELVLNNVPSSFNFQHLVVGTATINVQLYFIEIPKFWMVAVFHIVMKGSKANQYIQYVVAIPHTATMVPF